MSAPSLCSALAIALSSTFLMIAAPFFGVKARMLSALVDRLAAHQVGDQPALLGREAHAAKLGLVSIVGLPYFFGRGRTGAAAFLSAEWPLKVRVSANSPSLWPTMFSVT